MNDWVELLKAFAEVLKGVAWPIAIFLVLSKFRREIAHVLERLSHVKYRDAEAKFEVGKFLDEAEEHVEAIEAERSVLEQILIPIQDKAEAVEETLEPESPPRSFTSLVEDGLLTQTREYESLQELARISPRAAVMAAWSMVEAATMSLAEYSDTPARIRDSGIVMLDLENKKLASRTLVDLHRKLYGVRHEAAYDPNFRMDKYEAVRYLAVTLRLAAELQMLEEDLRSHGKDE
jgi:hypothetical protein